MMDLTGQLLIAMPGISDPRFAHAVILVCAHSPDYAMGLVLNKPLDDLTVTKLFDQLGIKQDIRLPETYVLNGGPVGTDRGFVLHSDDYFNQGATVDVSETLCMTATRDVLEAMARGGAPKRTAMVLGYSGWGAGQLEYEIGENAWLTSKPHDEIVFGQSHSRKWERSLELMGISPARLYSASGHA